MKVDSCIRHRVSIEGENFYFIIGADFIHATVAHENRPENQKLRQIVDSICAAITSLQGGEQE